MPELSQLAQRLSAEIWLVIFDCLAGDYETLISVGLVSRSWRLLSHRFLLKDVDLSSHNNGRLPEFEVQESALVLGVVMSDYEDKYRPRNLVPRQRAFIRLMTDRPELAIYVNSFAWTLVWIDFDEDELTEIDLQIWDVFSRMQNVTRLDLASLHFFSHEPYIRENPERLFPAVTDLRLVGWMHRGLVRAIVTSLDAGKLRSLKLDHLQDEGVLPNGETVPDELHRLEYHTSVDPYVDEGVNDEMWARQERGEGGIWPGPMGYPLRILRQLGSTSLTHLEIRLGRPSELIDQRNYISMFRETAEFIRSAKDTLKTISIALGEHPSLHTLNDGSRHWGASRMSSQHTYRPMCFDLSSALLHRVLPALTEERFLQLSRVDLEGFRTVRRDKSGLARPPNPDLTWQYIRECPFVDEEFTLTANDDYRAPFTGYFYYVPEEKLRVLEDLMEKSLGAR